MPVIITGEPTGPYEGEKVVITGCENICNRKRQNRRIRNLFIQVQIGLFHDNYGHIISAKHGKF